MEGRSPFDPEALGRDRVVRDRVVSERRNTFRDLPRRDATGYDAGYVTPPFYVTLCTCPRLPSRRFILSQDSLFHSLLSVEAIGPLYLFGLQLETFGTPLAPPCRQL